jgi:hypothetical protein
LLSPVNPKTDAKRCDRITIGAMTRTALAYLLVKPRCFVEQECADEVIDKSTDFRYLALS